MSTPPFTISQTTADARIKHWRDDQQTIQNALANHPQYQNLPPLTINAFTFHYSDLFDLFNRIGEYNTSNNGAPHKPIVPVTPTIENPINAIRFYLGVTPTPEPPFSCLIAVGVTGFNISQNNGGTDVLSISPLGSSIYDFSYPCPTTCPQTGGLGTS